MSVKPDMDMSEFMELCTASSTPDTTDWIVHLKLKDGSPDGQPSDLTIYNCHSEFEAKERAYLYLVDEIYNKK